MLKYYNIIILNLNKLKCIVMFCNNYRKSKKTKLSYVSENTLNLSIVYSKCFHEYKKIFKEEQTIEILKILGLINNIEEYQKTYNHALR